MRRAQWILLALAAVYGMLPASARAQDASGAWSGKATCTGFAGGEKFKREVAGELVVTQLAEEIRVLFNSRLYSGVPLLGVDLGKLEAPLVACTTAAAPLSDYGEAVHARFKLQGDAGTLKATSVFTAATPGREVATCKWKFRRSSVVSTALGTCPPI